MQIRAGFEISYECAQPTPMLLTLSIHPSRVTDLRTAHQVTFDPDIPADDYLDGFGNVCTRVTVPAGGLDLSCDFVCIGIGIVPNVELARKAGLSVDNGIVVDDFSSSVERDRNSTALSNSCRL